MPSALPRRILVTGATDGIGKETARVLAEAGAEVIVHGRTAEKAERARADIGARHAVAGDLAVLAEVRAMAARVVDIVGTGGLDALINNAGIYAKKRTLTADGRELTMAVNHDAPVLLTHLLLPHLAKSKDPRVVNVSSVAHGRGRIAVDDIDMERSWDPYGSYAASKLANVLFTSELARRLEKVPALSLVRVNALHPGVVSTKLLKAGFNMDGPDSVADGAATSVHLAMDPVTTTGGYFANARPARSSSAAADLELCRAFYDASCKRVGVEPL